MSGCHIKPEQFFNLIFGYYDRWVENLSHTKVGTGDYYMVFTAVPAGEVWVVQSITARNRSAADAIAVRIITSDGKEIYLVSETSSGAWGLVFWVGEMVLKEGDVINILFGSVTTGHIVDGWVWGYKMKVA